MTEVAGCTTHSDECSKTLVVLLTRLTVLGLVLVATDLNSAVCSCPAGVVDANNALGHRVTAAAVAGFVAAYSITLVLCVTTGRLKSNEWKAETAGDEKQNKKQECSPSALEMQRK